MPVGGGGGGGGSGEGSIGFGPISLSANTPLTIVRLKAASNRLVRLLDWGFYGSGPTSNSAPLIEIRIGRISADGTFSAGSPGPVDEDLPATFATDVGVNATVEPTYSSYLRTFMIHPQFSYETTEAPKLPIPVKGGGMLGFVATSPAPATISGFVSFDEGA